MKTHFIDKTEGLKKTRPSWKLKSVVGLLFERDGDDTKVETKMFSYSIHEKNMPETNLL